MPIGPPDVSSPALFCILKTMKGKIFSREEKAQKRAEAAKTLAEKQERAAKRMAERKRKAPENTDRMDTEHHEASDFTTHPSLD